MIEEYLLFILAIDQGPLQQLGRLFFFTAIYHDFKPLLFVPVRTILDVSRPGPTGPPPYTTVHTVSVKKFFLV